MSRGKEFKPELAAQAISHALYHGDKAACAQYKISDRSLSRYRERMKTDKDLANYVIRKVNGITADWQSEVPKTLAAVIQWVQNLCLIHAKTADPEMVRAITDAMTRVAQIHFASRVIDDRIGRGGFGGDGQGIPQGTRSLDRTILIAETETEDKDSKD